jgi:CRISPR type II-A-associated protein Csn2
MTLIKEKIEQPIEILASTPTLLKVGNINLLHKYVKDIKSLCKGEEGSFKIFDISNQISFEKEVEIISNILDISLNNTKSLNNLRKKIEKEIANTDLIFEIDKLKDEQIKLIRNIKENILVNIDYDEEQELTDLLKFYGVKFHEDYDSLCELLIKYLEILKDYSKIKVIFLVFALQLFNNTEINEIIKFCSYNGIILVFMEVKQLTDTEKLNAVREIYIDDEILIKIDD